MIDMRTESSGDDKSTTPKNMKAAYELHKPALRAGSSYKKNSFKEKEFEDILVRYPELIEPGLELKGRQVNVNRKFVDILYKDRHGQRLIIELKSGTIIRKHVAQLMDYEGYFLTPDDPTIRVMLVGNRVPNNLRRSLDHHGFEWREIPVIKIIEFLI